MAMETNVMMRAWRCAAVAGALAAAPCVRAQEVPKPAKPVLDSRSVLMSWTNEPGTNAAPVQPAVAADETATVDMPSKPEVRALIEHAQRLSGQGKLAEAIAAMRQALDLDPKDRRARFGLGTVYIQAEQYSNALAVLEPLTVEYPKDYFLRNNIAWLYATAKDHRVRDGAKAIRMAQEALLLAPNDYHVWSTLAEGYYVAGQYDRALRAAEEALRIGQQSGATAGNIIEYRRQIDKSHRAVQAMSLVE